MLSYVYMYQELTQSQKDPGAFSRGNTFILRLGDILKHVLIFILYTYYVFISRQDLMNNRLALNSLRSRGRP